MADNTQLNLGTGGDVIKTEDVGPFKIAVSKIYLGAAGLNDGPVTPTNPMPVSVGNFPATQAVSAAALPLPAGAAIASKQPAIGAAGSPAADVLTVQGAPAMAPLKVDGSATTQPVSGSVAVSNFPAVQAVSVNNFPAVSAVSVGNFPAVQAVSGSVAVTGAVAANANLILAGSPVATNNPVPVTSVAALPPGTNTIGAVISQVATGVVYNGTTGLTPKFAAIAASATGDNTIVSGVAGKKVRVLKYTIVTSGAVVAKFRTSSGADLTGAMALAANSGVGGAFCPVGLFETSPGDALLLTLTGGGGVAGHLTYIEV